MPYGTSIGGVVLRQGLLSPGIGRYLDTFMMVCGRAHNDLTATSMELGYMDCREIAMTTVRPN